MEKVVFEILEGFRGILKGEVGKRFGKLGSVGISLKLLLEFTVLGEKFHTLNKALAHITS